LLKHQLLISNRSRQRVPKLTSIDRFVLGLTTLFVSPHRIGSGRSGMNTSIGYSSGMRAIGAQAE